MKTRIVFTKIWQDSFFVELTPTQKLLFMYYITNDNIGLTGYYEITNRQVAFDTGLTNTQIEECKQIFQKAKKIYFYQNWVYVKKAREINHYTGEKLDKAVEDELSLIPSEILKAIDTLLIEYDDVSIPTDTSINHKSEVLNHKLETFGDSKEPFPELDVSEFDQIAIDYKIPISFVYSKWDDIKNYCLSNGKRYRDYKATLRNWVKKDSLKIRKEENERSKITVIEPDPSWEMAREILDQKN